MSVLGVGIDLVELARVRRLLARRREQALARFLSDAERDYVESRPDPVPHIAARLAAKEAVYKALQALPGCRGVGWREIEVWRDESGKPSVVLNGLAAEALAAHGPLHVHLSLTHTHVSASAVAVLERP
ncbi:MAG TPA: holo-ACP synthase [Gemmatimonadales bacterium]|jgi:holo-[acyl-carrier protein] synthase|nr:holo-ACP synthase [Gemmatimonadales bacterium]